MSVPPYDLTRFLGHPLLGEGSTQTFLRVFGPARLSAFLHHQWRMRHAHENWFVFVDLPVARCFTRWVGPVKAVKNPRSITGIQKYIASAKNSGAIF